MLRRLSLVASLFIVSNCFFPYVYLEEAYRAARKRPDSLKAFRDIAAEHVNGEKIYMGDIHGAARAFARSHIVAPEGHDAALRTVD